MSYVTKLIKKETVTGRIKSIAARGKILDKDIAIVAVQALMHAEKFEDYNMAASLVKALGRAHRAKALMSWFETFGPFQRKYKGKAKTFDGFKKDKGKDATPFNIVEAETIPFWNLTPEPEHKAVTFETVSKMIDNVLKKTRELDAKDMNKAFKYATDTLV